MIDRHFTNVERRDADGWATIEDAETVRAFVASLDPGVEPELPSFDLPIRARRASSVFVATKGGLQQSVARGS